jgi:Flp pilus assembly protein TadB
MTGVEPLAAPLACASAALAVAFAIRPSAGRRLSALARTWSPESRAEPSGPQRTPPVVPSRAWACAIGGVGAAVLVGGPAGVAAGLVASAVAWVVTGRLEPAAVRRRREALEAALPLAVDLIAACLHAGRPPAQAAQVVAQAIEGPLGDELAVLAARLSLGADPVGVWRGVDADHPLASLARVMARSLETGAPASQGLTRLADDLRRDRRAGVDKAARSVGVRATAPLGLCFLPAFVLIGIVPAVVSVFWSMQLW